MNLIILYTSTDILMQYYITHRHTHTHTRVCLHTLQGHQETHSCAYILSQETNLF